MRHDHQPRISRLQTCLSRRTFLKLSAVVGSGFAFVPGSALGLNGSQPANNRLNIAGIGIGGQGARDLENFTAENIVALCDADHARGAGTFEKHPKAKRYVDYRRMLEEVKEIDAVVVATPDHHHASASLAAIRLGKHVYCEKPLTHSVWEARTVANEARKAGVATQMGNQRQASEETREFCETIWSGAIGKVREVHVWTDRPSRGLHEVYWPQGITRPTDTPAVPETLDWNVWLGPAPARPYHPAYAPFTWRGWWDFGTGALGDIGCHSMDPVFRALKLGAPLRVQASCTRVNGETYPLGSMVTWHFPARTKAIQTLNTHVRKLSGEKAGGIAMPECKVVWYDGGLRPPRPKGLPKGTLMGENGTLVLGDDGFLLGKRLYTRKGLQETKPKPWLERSSAEHYGEWAQACKGGPAAGSNFDWAGPLAEAVLLGNVALRPDLREDLTLSWLEWDSENLKFPNMEEANAFLRRDYREW